MPIKGLLRPFGMKPTLFRDFASKVAGLQVHTATPIHSYFPIKRFFCDKNISLGEISHLCGIIHPMKKIFRDYFHTNSLIFEVDILE